MMLGGLTQTSNPYLQLDQVLTEVELKDDEKRAFALRILKDAGGAMPEVSTVGGAAVLIMGLLGVLMTTRPTPDPGRESGSR